MRFSVLKKKPSDSNLKQITEQLYAIQIIFNKFIERRTLITVLIKKIKSLKKVFFKSKSGSSSTYEVPSQSPRASRGAPDSTWAENAAGLSLSTWVSNT